MIVKNKAIQLLGCLAIVLQASRSMAQVREFVVEPHADCQLCGDGLLGTCCEHQGKGFDLWSGYCFEKPPAYARPALSTPLLMRQFGRKTKCRCQVGPGSSINCVDCPSCNHSGSADSTQLNENRSHSSQPAPAEPTPAEHSEHAEESPLTETAETSIRSPEPGAFGSPSLDIGNIDTDDDVEDGVNISEQNTSAPDDIEIPLNPAPSEEEDFDVLIPSNSIESIEQTDVELTIPENFSEVDEETAEQILDSLPDNSIDNGTETENADEELEEQIRELLEGAVSATDHDDQVSAITVSFRKRLQAQQLRAARKAQTRRSNKRSVEHVARSEDSPVSNIRTSSSNRESAPEPKATLPLNRPDVNPVSSSRVMIDTGRSSKLAADYRDHLSKRLRKTSQTEAATKVSDRLVDHLRYVGE